MTARARQELARARQIVIFPEGTRRPPGAEPIYKPGIAHLYSKAGVALRAAGAQFRAVLAAPFVAPLFPAPFWSKFSIRSRRGSTSGPFCARLQSVLEAATARLVAEGSARSAIGTAQSLIRWLTADCLVGPLSRSAMQMQSVSR